MTEAAFMLMALARYVMAMEALPWRMPMVMLFATVMRSLAAKTPWLAITMQQQPMLVHACTLTTIVRYAMATVALQFKMPTVMAFATATRLSAVKTLWLATTMQRRPMLVPAYLLTATVRFATAMAA
jgi:hypothetical protein